jgi:prepilin-type N-terminal cleavage/methylation domain-containing protein
MYMKQSSRNRGFTIIELMVVIVVLFVLVALVGLTANGVQAKNRNGDRQADIDALRVQLESYYAGNDKYPTLANLNTPSWLNQNLPRLQNSSLDDPRWSKEITDCTQNGRTVLASEPLPNCYSYQVTTSVGSACDNKVAICAHYTLTATLEGGEKYVKASLN